MSWRCKIQQEYYRDGYTLYLKNGDACLTGLPFVKQPEVTILEGVPVEQGMFQALADELWATGFRPSGYADVHESVKAKDVHLQDMRAIVFSKLNVEKP